MKIKIDLGSLLRKAAPIVVPLVVAAVTNKATSVGEKLIAKAAKPKA